jgi:hypothetical protein
MSIHAEIETFLSDYFEVLYTQDLDLFGRVFLPESVLYSQADGVTTVRPISVYRDILAHSASPESLGQPRHEEVKMIDILSPEMALVRVQLRLFDSIMADHLCLLHTDKGWRIAAKTYTRVGPA